MRIPDKFMELSPCAEGVRWLDNFLGTPKSAWMSCSRADWMLWFLYYSGQLNYPAVLECQMRLFVQDEAVQAAGIMHWQEMAAAKELWDFLQLPDLKNYTQQIIVSKLEPTRGIHRKKLHPGRRVTSDVQRMLEMFAQFSRRCDGLRFLDAWTCFRGLFIDDIQMHNKLCGFLVNKFPDAWKVVI